MAHMFVFHHILSQTATSIFFLLVSKLLTYKKNKHFSRCACVCVCVCALQLWLVLPVFGSRAFCCIHRRGQNNAAGERMITLQTLERQGPRDSGAALNPGTDCCRVTAHIWQPGGPLSDDCSHNNDDVIKCTISSECAIYAARYKFILSQL